MANDTLPPAQSSAAEHRRKRLAETLRLNLQRRKGQARARRAGAADETDGLPAATGAADAARPGASAGQHPEGQHPDLQGPARPYDDGKDG